MTIADVSTAVDWLRLVRSEYREMPDLRLTRSQARRLWGLDDPTCVTTLDALVKENFLRIAADGRYTRSDSGGGPVITVVPGSQAFGARAIVNRNNTRMGSNLRRGRY